MDIKPVGIIHTPFETESGTPIQPIAGIGVKGEVEIFREFLPGLKSLSGFSHIILLYHLHRQSGYKLEIMPFMDSTEHGVFATRAPARPNPIGMSIVRLISVDQNILVVENVDMLDGTPLLDIKPFVPEFDCFDIRDTDKYGWLEKRKHQSGLMKADDRFTDIKNNRKS